MVNVAVGSPEASVPREVESDSHEGNAWVGADMNGCQTDTDGRSVNRAVLEVAGIGAVEVRKCSE